MDNWEKEFGSDYHPGDAVLAALKAAGFEDESWHNDACPSFSRGVKYDPNDVDWTCEFYLWIDHPDPKMREGMRSWDVESCRFTVLNGMEADSEVVFESNEGEALIKWLGGLPPAGGTN